jgi:hypothetical protein
MVNRVDKKPNHLGITRARRILNLDNDRLDTYIWKASLQEGKAKRRTKHKKKEAQQAKQINSNTENVGHELGTNFFTLAHSNVKKPPVLPLTHKNTVPRGISYGTRLSVIPPKPKNLLPSPPPLRLRRTNKNTVPRSLLGKRRRELGKKFLTPAHSNLKKNPVLPLTFKNTVPRSLLGVTADKTLLEALAALNLKLNSSEANIKGTPRRLLRGKKISHPNHAGSENKWKQIMYYLDLVKEAIKRRHESDQKFLTLAHSNVKKPPVLLLTHKNTVPRRISYRTRPSVIPPGKWRHKNGILYTEEFKDITEQLNQRAANKFGILLNKLSESKRALTKSSKNAKVIKAEEKFKKIAKKAAIANKRAADAANRIGARFKVKRNRKKMKNLLEIRKKELKDAQIMANRLQRPLTGKQKTGMLLSRFDIPSNLINTILKDWTDPTPDRTARRLEIETKMREEAALNNEDIKIAKKAKDKKGKNILYAVRQKKEEEEKQKQRELERKAANNERKALLLAKLRAVFYLLAGKAKEQAAEMAGKAKEQAAAMPGKAKNIVVKYVRNGSSLTRQLAKMAASSRQRLVAYLDEERKKLEQSLIEHKERANKDAAISKMKNVIMRRKREKIERLNESKRIRKAIKDILTQLDEIKESNKKIKEKNKLLREAEVYKKWKNYITSIDTYKEMQQIHGRPSGDRPIPDPYMTFWAAKKLFHKFGPNLTLEKMTSEMRHMRPPATIKEMISNIEDLKKRKEDEQPLKQKLMALREQYEKLFV